MKILRKIFSVAGKAKLAERAAKKASKDAVAVARSLGVPDGEMKAVLGKIGIRRGKTQQLPEAIQNSMRVGRSIGKDLADHGGKFGLHDVITLRGRVPEHCTAATVARTIPNVDKPTKMAKRLGKSLEHIRDRYDHGKPIAPAEKLKSLKKLNLRNLNTLQKG